MPADPRSRLLIFEPKADGHTAEWLRHLLDAAGDRPVVCVVAAPVAGKLSRPAGRDVTLLALDERERRACAADRAWLSGLARWRVLRRYLRRTGCDEVLALEADHLTLPLALGLPLGGARFAGVLFRPSVHYGDFAGHRASRAERLRGRLKGLLYGRLLRRRDVGTLWTLDPYFPAWAAARLAGGHKVRHLPDPVNPAALDGVGSDRAGPGDDRRRFVLFGALGERKGVLVLLDALARLSPAAGRRTRVVLAGRVDPRIAAAVAAGIARLRAAPGGADVRLDDRWLGDGEIAGLVRWSDVVLAPYQRFVGSSGVLLWAAAAGRPVITQDRGLLGELTRRHGLGTAVDTTDPAALAAAVGAAALDESQPPFDRERARTLVAGHGSGRFARLLLDGIDATERAGFSGVAQRTHASIA